MPDSFMNSIFVFCQAFKQVTLYLKFGKAKNFISLY